MSDEIPPALAGLGFLAGFLSPVTEPSRGRLVRYTEIKPGTAARVGDRAYRRERSGVLKRIDSLEARKAMKAKARKHAAGLHASMRRFGMEETPANHFAVLLGRLVKRGVKPTGTGQARCIACGRRILVPTVS